MDLKHLEYFARVAESGSFTRAAQQVGVAQPALSRQVRALETELRQTLFHRNGRGASLTDAGRRLLAHSRTILRQVELARQDLDEHRGVPVGRFTLGLPPSVSRSLTVPLVEVFRTRFPKATLTIVEGLSIYLLEWLAEGRVDCAVVHTGKATATTDLQLVMREPLYLITRRRAGRGARRTGPAVSLDDVARHELVIPSRPHSIRMLVEAALAAQSLAPTIGAEIESVPAMLDLVERTQLAAVLALDALRHGGRDNAFMVRPIVTAAGPLSTPLSIATSSLRARSLLLDLGTALVSELLLGTRGGARPKS